MNVFRIWHRWLQEGHTERCDGSQWTYISHSQDDRHRTHMTLIYHTGSSRTLGQEMEPFTRQEIPQGKFEDACSNIDYQVDKHVFGDT